MKQVECPDCGSTKFYTYSAHLLRVPLSASVDENGKKYQEEEYFDDIVEELTFLSEPRVECANCEATGVRIQSLIWRDEEEVGDIARRPY